MDNRMKSEAILSVDRKYRYVLTRTWDETLPNIMFVGLNPSTADETTDDPTIRRCINFAKSWGYGGLYMVNLFAYRSTNPNNIRIVDNPISDNNDSYISHYAKLSDKVVACWGNRGSYQKRSKEVTNLLEEIYCFGQNKSGEPKHPFYLKKEISLIKYK